MKVKELIEELQKLDQEKIIRINSDPDFGDPCDITKVVLKQDYKYDEQDNALYDDDIDDYIWEEVYVIEVD